MFLAHWGPEYTYPFWDHTLLSIKIRKEEYFSLVVDPFNDQFKVVNTKDFLKYVQLLRKIDFTLTLTVTQRQYSSQDLRVVFPNFQIE